MEKLKVTIYTDGGCDPNPGPGGWACILIFEKDGAPIIKELSGGETETTNNRMELTAAIQALKALNRPCQVDLYTDSQYLKKCIEGSIEKWKAKDYKGVKNPELWQTLDQEVHRHEIKWNWVKGHAGNHYNERCDELATAAIPRVQQAPRDENTAAAYLAISCSGAPGVGAWAAMIEKQGKETILSGGQSKTYANRLDLLAAIGVLEAVPAGEAIIVFTPNSYLYDGITTWIKSWKKSNWIKKTGGEVQYRDLWEKLDSLAESRKVQWSILKNGERPQRERLTEVLQSAMEKARTSGR